MVVNTDAGVMGLQEKWCELPSSVTQATKACSPDVPYLWRHGGVM